MIIKPTRQILENSSNISNKFLNEPNTDCVESGKSRVIDIQDRWIGTNSSIKPPLPSPAPIGGSWREERARDYTRWQLIKALSKLICGAAWPAVCKVGMRRVCHAEWVTDRALNWDGRTTTRIRHGRPPVLMVESYGRQSFREEGRGRKKEEEEERRDKWKREYWPIA